MSVRRDSATWQHSIIAIQEPWTNPIFVNHTSSNKRQVRIALSVGESHRGNGSCGESMLLR